MCAADVDMVDGSFERIFECAGVSVRWTVEAAKE